MKNLEQSLLNAKKFMDHSAMNTSGDKRKMSTPQTTTNNLQEAQLPNIGTSTPRQPNMNPKANMSKEAIMKSGLPDAIKKATEVAKRSLIKIPLKDGRTLHHDVKGKNGSGKVFLRAAPAGTGIIAGGAIRSVCEVLGVQDVVAKSLGSSNPHNVLKACVNGLKSQNSPKTLSNIRGKKISEIVSKREAK